MQQAKYTCIKQASILFSVFCVTFPKKGTSWLAVSTGGSGFSRPTWSPIISWTGAQGPFYPHCLVLRHQHGLSWWHWSIGFAVQTLNQKHSKQPTPSRHISPCFFFPNAIASPQQKWSRQHHRSKNPKIRPNSGKTEITAIPNMWISHQQKKNDKGFLPSSPNPPLIGASVVQDQRWNKQWQALAEDWHLSSMCFHSLSKVRLRGLNVACLSCIELGDLVEFVTQTNVYLLEPLACDGNKHPAVTMIVNPRSNYPSPSYQNSNWTLQKNWCHFNKTSIKVGI